MRMCKGSVVAAIGAVLSVYAAGAAEEPAGLRQVENQQISSVSSNVAELKIAFEISGLSVTTNQAGGAVFTGLPVTGSGGAPALPCQSVRLLLPREAVSQSVTIRLQDEETESVPGAWDVEPAGPPYGTNGPVWPTGSVIVDGRDTTIYSTNALFPGSHLFMPRAGSLREWKLAMFSIYPYRYNPVTQSLVVLTEGTLVVRYEHNAAEGISSAPENPSVQALISQARRRRDLRQSVLNFEQMQGDYDE